MAMTKKEQAYVAQLELDLNNAKHKIELLQQQLTDKPKTALSYTDAGTTEFKKVYLPEHADIRVDLPNRVDEITIRLAGRGIIVSSMHNTMAVIPQASNSIFITAGRDVFDMQRENNCR